MMDPFFFRNRLSAWLDRELPAAESRELEQAMELQPELRAEADEFRKQVELIRALRLSAPPEVMAAAMQVPAPAWRPGWLALGVAGILIVSGIWLLWHREPAGTPGEAEMAKPAEEVAPPAAAIAPTAEATPAAASPAPVAGETPTTAPISSPYVPKNSSHPKGHARMTVVIPKDVVEDPDATDYAEEDPLPNPAPVQSFRYRLSPTDPNTALKALKDLVTRMNGQFLNAGGSPKATYPLEPGSADRVLLKVSAANLVILVQNLSTIGTVGVLAQPAEVPPSGMVGVLVEVDAPPQ